MISPVEASDQGYYQCEASNGVGNNINAVIALQVQRKSVPSSGLHLHSISFRL